MKSLVIFLFAASIVLSGSIPPVKNNSDKPYETTWMEITETDSGYIVYNYPNLNFDMQSPYKLIVKTNTLTWVGCIDSISSYPCNKIDSLGDGKYYFPVSNHFQFEWFDKDKHIARWIIFNGYGEIQNNNLYIDSLYNTFPIVDFVWEEE